MEYEDECQCCGEGVTITGAYIGCYDIAYCEDCGWESEFCNESCEKCLRWKEVNA